MLARYEYDVFGAIRNETGTSDNTRKFTGKEFDADSKLYYYGARYYDPYIGRFTQRDPVGQGVNWYAYTANNLLAFVDPTGLRAVNEIEREALIFTFGEAGADLLIEEIEIDIQFNPEVGGGRVPGDSSRIIELNPDYDSGDLYWLSLFIHEATHIWQIHTGLYREDGDYQYTLDQLHSLELNREEHASAVQNWFVVNYAYTHGLVGDGPGQMDPITFWVKTLHQILGFSHDNIRDTRDSAKIWTINVHYERVINQIRDSTLLPPPVTKLGQNFPNPAD